MDTGSGGNYLVDSVPIANAQARDLLQRTQDAKKRSLLLAAFKAAIHRLQSDPGSWGDPLFHSFKSVGYRGVEPPIVLHYLVFPAERKVCILSVKVLPGFLPE